MRVFPARAGMNRLSPRTSGVPRPRGDEPAGRLAVGVFPARAGMNRWSALETAEARVFPARAGMNRILFPADRPSNGVPRPRGDEPEGGSVPRPRGDEPVLERVAGRVFPARAGMNRHNPEPRISGVPRPRGDEPGLSASALEGQVCSPPARG